MKPTFKITPAKAEGDSESNPTKSGIQTILDSGGRPGPNPGFVRMINE
jgi:hypothetical protein